MTWENLKLSIKEDQIQNGTLIAIAHLFLMSKKTNYFIEYQKYLNEMTKIKKYISTNQLRYCFKNQICGQVSSKINSFLKKIKMVLLYQIIKKYPKKYIAILIH